MYKYKNETDNEQIIVGIGLIPANAEFQTNRVIENPNFSLIDADVETPAEKPVTETNTEEII